MSLRVALISIAMPCCYLSPAFAADTCKTTLECGQVALTTAAEAQAAEKIFEEKLAALKLKIVCKTVQATSSRGRFPSVVARLSDQDTKDGFVVTGGGCEQVQPNNNFTFVSSRPEGTGWFCQTGDVPGIAQNVQVQATAIGCKTLTAQ